MSRGQSIFNVGIAIAVGVLFWLYFSDRNNQKNRKPAIVAQAHDTAKNGFRIAYFEMDSVTNSFGMVREVKQELSREEERINGEMSHLQKTFNDRMAQYQKQPMSAIQSEQANKEMLQLQEHIRQRKQEMDQKYQDLYMRKMQDVKSKIEDFLKDYNQNHSFSYILGYEPGFIFYRDSTLNITEDVIKGLNQRYHPGK